MDLAKTHWAGLIWSAWKVEIKRTSGQYQQEGQGERNNHRVQKLHQRHCNDNYLPSSVKVMFLSLSYENFRT